MYNDNNYAQRTNWFHDTRRIFYSKADHKNWSILISREINKWCKNQNMAFPLPDMFLQLPFLKCTFSNSCR